MYDFVAKNPSPGRIVAAAPGWVRYIDDSHVETVDQDGKDNNKDNNYVWIEHPYPYCPVDSSRSKWPNKPADYDSTCIPCDREFCNEWTMYAHMTEHSVRVDAGLTEGDWVEAGDFLGFEDDIGDADGVHLHWWVAVIPPDVGPTFNGYYLDYVKATGTKPELIPVVCHAGGRSVLWRNVNYTAVPCPAAFSAPAQTLVPGISATGSPLGAVIGQVAEITDEAIAIALASPDLLFRTRNAFVRLDPAYRNLTEVGRASISQEELELLLGLLDDYAVRGSYGMGRNLQAIRQRLEDPGQRASLGITVRPPFPGLD